MRYGLAVVLVGIAHGASAMFPTLAPALTSFFLAAVLIASLYGGLGPGLLATALSTIDLDYRFTRPYYSLELAFDDLVWVLAFLLVALLTSSLQARRRRAEDSLRIARQNLEQQVEARTAELMRSQQELVQISERERQRIGHDLHDGLGQELTGISMLITSLAQRLRDEGFEDAAEADHVTDLIHESIRHARDLAKGLCPVDLEEGGLSAALQLLADRLGRLPGVTCTFNSEVTVELDDITASHLFRIAQEAVNNAIRHGQARQITIALLSKAGQCELTVTDDGVGFPTGVRHSGMGLRLMEHRAKAIGAKVRIGPNNGRGTIVQCRFDRSQSAA